MQRISLAYMTTIITISVLLILAYIFDISSKKTKIPAVFLLLVLGWTVKQISDRLDLVIPNLNQILPVLGTMGLILIVLEGSLELELNRSNLKLLGKTILISLISIILFSVAFAFVIQYYAKTDLTTGLTNAIPFAVISSAIAIPSVKSLAVVNREFVTYESSFSDIFGVIIFNFFTLNDQINITGVGQLFEGVFIVSLISILATVILIFLLGKITHHVKFLPIIIVIVLIFTILKIYHLPSLVFILLFGLLLSNFDKLRRNRLIAKLGNLSIKQEIHKFKEFTTEVAFLIRSLFFILFGFLINTSELINSETFLWAIAICLGIFIIRYLLFKLFKVNMNPLLFIAPRGLITILLFLSIPIGKELDFINKSLVIQVVILSTIVMMFGLIKHRNGSTNNSINSSPAATHI